MEARSLGQALKLIMKNREWTQTELARELGVSQVWVSQVSREQRDTGIIKASRLLARVGWELRITPIGEEDDPVKRRSFIAAAASVTLVPSAKASPYKDSEYVRALAARLNRTRYEIGGVPLVATASRHLNKIAQAINVRDRNLQVASSGLARTASFVLYDARFLERADNAGRLALVLAQRSDDIDAIAHSYESLSQISTSRGDYRRAAMYAQRGLALPELTNERKARLNIRLGLSLAMAHAHGKERRSRQLLDVARGLDGFSWETMLAIVGNSGVALSRLGRHEEAARSMDEVMNLVEGRQLSRGLWLGESAQAALRASDPLKAADRMSALAHVGPLITSSHFDQKVNEIIAGTARWANVPEMRDAREQLRAVQPSAKA
ncbi:hypothetical protein GCM10029978_027140 [Actinoallomurus acanthiterrae]